MIIVVGINSILFGLLALTSALESISKETNNNYKYYMLFLSGMHVGIGLYLIVSSFWIFDRD
jgi:hypothetical protein